MPVKVAVSEDELAGVPEAIRGEYKEGDDGRFYLEAEGIDEHPTVAGLRKTLKKFRDVEPNADRLKARLERLDRLEGFADMDPAEVKEKLQKLEELEASGAGNTEEIRAELQELFEKRSKAQETEWQKKLGKQEEVIGQKDAFIRRMLIDRALDEALDEVGVLKPLKPGARALLKGQGPEVVQDADTGYRAIFRTDLADLDVVDFVKKWATSEEAKYYMPASGNNGSGAGGGSGGGGGGHRNPFARETRNLTEQAKMFKENPELARQLAAQAGVTLG